FKLITGTWVHVGKLRTAFVSAAQVLNDAVICGHDRECVAALAWLNTVEAARVTGSDDIDDPALRAHLARCLAHLNEGAGSALRIERLLLLAKPPDNHAGRVDNKG